MRKDERKRMRNRERESERGKGGWSATGRWLVVVGGAAGGGEVWWCIRERDGRERERWVKESVWDGEMKEKKGGLLPASCYRQWWRWLMVVEGSGGKYGSMVRKGKN